MTEYPTNGGTKDRQPGWAVREDVNWSYRPALIATIVAIILGPALFLIGYLPRRNDQSVVYPALHSQLTQPNGATAGQPPTPQPNR